MKYLPLGAFGHHVLELPSEQAAVERQRGFGVGLAGVDPAGDAGDVAVSLGHGRLRSTESEGLLLHRTDQMCSSCDDFSADVCDRFAGSVPTPLRSPHRLLAGLLSLGWTPNPSVAQGNSCSGRATRGVGSRTVANRRGGQRSGRRVGVCAAVARHHAPAGLLDRAPAAWRRSGCGDGGGRPRRRLGHHLWTWDWSDDGETLSVQWFRSFPTTTSSSVRIARRRSRTRCSFPACRVRLTSLPG